MLPPYSHDPFPIPGQEVARRTDGKWNSAFRGRIAQEVLPVQRDQVVHPGGLRSGQHPRIAREARQGLAVLHGLWCRRWHNLDPAAVQQQSQQS